jgi:hypothetical protein
MRAVSLRLLLTSRALPRQCLGAGLKRSGVVASSLATSSSSFWSRALRRSCLPKAPFAAVDDAYPLAAIAAERPVLDEPKSIGSASACRAAEMAPRPAVPELRMRKADELRLVVEWDHGVRRVELDDAAGAQSGDFHAQELVEKTAMIGVGATFVHGLRITLAHAKRKAFNAHRAIGLEKQQFGSLEQDELTLTA